ncbi:MAG: tetratricopeptide repeat protein [Deltaproteobacteria bacterium]|nr:tetratricopeptide repeat protein [Kofleriaceae bacterium]
MSTVITYALVAPILAFAVWGLVQAFRFRDWIWIPIQLVLPVVGAFVYFFAHLHRHADSGFELPGAADKKRLGRVMEDLARLDKAHLHAQLGDIYYAMGQHDKALAAYRAAFERDRKDLDIRAHLGATLVRIGRAEEARSLLEGVVEEKPRHDHGYTMMALAEAQTVLGDGEAATATWKRVLAGNSYGRARVQLAELHVEKGEMAEARALLEKVVEDDASSPDFHRQREAVWVKRARKLLKQVPMKASPDA